jgi:protein-S-isoprenylcysteine O-methyltransferase Ste14
MTFETYLFRFRLWLFLALYLLGFWAPWEFLWRAPGTRPGTVWLALSTLLARTGWVGLSSATVIVTCLALACMTVGAVLRVWGTAYLSVGVMSGRVMQGKQVVAAGPFRFVRNPLYLGSGLFGVGVSFLMPPSGALFYVIAMGLLTLLLVRGEERFLSSQMGTAYEQYRRLVPRFVPRLRAGIPPSDIRPRWLQSLMAEVMVVGYTLCFAVFAWRYNVEILVRCLLICFGASLVLRALLFQGSAVKPLPPSSTPSS